MAMWQAGLRIVLAAGVGLAVTAGGTPAGAAPAGVVTAAHTAASLEIPAVHADPALPAGWVGKLGVPIKFTFSPGDAGDVVTGYRYWTSGQQPAAVRAAADGTATIAFVPNQVGTVQLNVVATGCGGTVSEAATFIFRVSVD